MARPFPESEVLLLRDPSLDFRTDEWPEFELTNVHVHLPDDVNATTSLLEAAAHYPLAVVGQLEPLPEELTPLYCQRPRKKRIDMVLTDVRMFSYGQYPDGTVALWAAGKAGWYTIRPGKAYNETYASMVGAVETFYFFADLYKLPRKSGRGKSAALLPDYGYRESLEKYAAEVLADPSKVKEAATQLDRHKEFILSCMISGKEGLAWSQLPLYKRMYRQYPDVYTKLKERIHGKAAGRSPPRDRSIGADSSANSTTKHGGPTKSKKPHDDVSNAGVQSKKASKFDASRSEASSSAPSQIPARHPGSSRRTRRKANDVLAPVPHTVDARSTKAPAGDVDSDDDLQAWGKSGLRLQGSKGSKSAKRNVEALLPVENSEEEEDPAASPPRIQAGKRKIEDTAPHPQRPLKRRNSRMHADEGIHIPTSPSASGESPSALDTTLSAVHDLAIRTLHQPDPLQEDTWVCALDGCTHKVYAASEPESQKLIREHYALHAYDDDERVKLVKRLQAPSLPVAHLMERVRVQAKLDGFPGSKVAGTRFPNTVVQRY